MPRRRESLMPSSDALESLTTAQTTIATPPPTDAEPGHGASDSTRVDAAGERTSCGCL